MKELNEAYQHFFFHYTATPLLVVETSQIDFGRSDDAVDDLIRQIAAMGRGHAVLRADGRQSGRVEAAATSLQLCGFAADSATVF